MASALLNSSFWIWALGRKICRKFERVVRDRLIWSLPWWPRVRKLARTPRQKTRLQPPKDRRSYLILCIIVFRQPCYKSRNCHLSIKILKSFRGRGISNILLRLRDGQRQWLERPQLAQRVHSLLLLITIKILTGTTIKTLASMWIRISRNKWSQAIWKMLEI